MKIRRQIAAIACAAALAAQGMAISAAADDASGWYYYYNGYYYGTLNDAWAAVGSVDGSKVTSVPAASVPKDSAVWYSATTKGYYNSQNEAQAAGAADANLAYRGTYGVSVPTTSTSTWWYSEVTKTYYPTYTEALNHSNGISSYVKEVPYYNYYYNGYGYYGYTYYVSSVTGLRYSSYSSALAASNYDSSKVTQHYTGYDPNYNYAAGSIYRYRYNGVYYGTLDEAKRAGGTALGVDIFYTPYGSTGDVSYYYYYNGTYYGSLQAAKNAGGTALGTDITYVPYGYYGVNYGYGYDYGYNYNYLYPYGYGNMYNFIDPYYTFRNQIKSKNETTTSTKEAEDGEPYIYGKKNKAGWDIIVKYAKAAASGSTLKVNMNGAYEVDKDVLEAIDGKNVSITFVLDNGVKWTVNGKNVSTPKDMVIYTEYNIKYIPDSLVKKASKDAVGKAQIGISSNFDEFGSKSNVTVKFSSDRAGCTAVVYRYDPDANSLKGVSKAKVQSDGSATFTVTAGGPYLIVLK